MEQLEGLIADIIFQSEDGMFCVLRIDSKQHGKTSAVYHGSAPYLGENVVLEGRWVEHVRFGRQFDAVVCRVVQPTSAAGIERFKMKISLTRWLPLFRLKMIIPRKDARVG